jgi:hypothetical protein
MTSELQCYRFLWDQGEPLEAHHRFPAEGYEVVRACQRRSYPAGVWVVRRSFPAGGRRSYPVVWGCWWAAVWGSVWLVP